jgi:non-ribosomal peptide synthetase component E (peptide arylation enzyme)
MPDRELGERACAYVVPKTGTNFSFDEMIDYLKEQSIAKYKFPERLEIINSLPLSHGGKYDKMTLREDIINKLKREGKI